MNVKDSLIARFKHSVPCFLCNASVKNNENFCAKCKKSVIGKSPTPIPKLPRKISEEKSKFFYVRPKSPLTQKSLLKETACFNDPGPLRHSIDRSITEKSHQKESSVDYMRPSIYSKRPESSLDVIYPKKVKNSKSHYKNPSKSRSKQKLYKLSKSPIPELRPQSQMSKSIEVSYTTPNLTHLSTHELHRNTLTDLCYSREALYTVSLDYKLNSYDGFSLIQISSETAHNRGILHISPYKDSLVTSSKDGRLKYWTSKCIYSNLAHKGGVIAMTADCSSVITANTDCIKVWQNTHKVLEFTEKKNLHLTCVNKNNFLSGGEKQLKMWDLRAKSAVIVFESAGGYRCSCVWDENSFWSASEQEIKKWDVRSCGVLQSIKAGSTRAMCKARQQLITAGAGLGLYGKSLISGNFSCVKFFEDPNWIATGNYEGCLDFYRLT